MFIFTLNFCFFSNAGKLPTSLQNKILEYGTENTYLIVGIGNPGKEFVNSRHNVGFRFIDYLQKYFRAKGADDPSFIQESDYILTSVENMASEKTDVKLLKELLPLKLITSEMQEVIYYSKKGSFRTDFAEFFLVELDQKLLILSRAFTYVNHTGEYIEELLNNTEILKENILIVHDELTELGTFTVKETPYSGKHNGIISIQNAFGANVKLKQLAIGVGTPKIHEGMNKKEVMRTFVDHVLSPMDQYQLIKISRNAFLNAEVVIENWARGRGFAAKFPYTPKGDFNEVQATKLYQHHVLGKRSSALLLSEIDGLSVPGFDGIIFDADGGPKLNFSIKTVKRIQSLKGRLPEAIKGVETFSKKANWNKLLSHNPDHWVAKVSSAFGAKRDSARKSVILINITGPGSETDQRMLNFIIAHIKQSLIIQEISIFSNGKLFRVIKTEKHGLLSEARELKADCKQTIYNFLDL